MHAPPVENPICGEVPKTVPLDFKEDDVMWVASKALRRSRCTGSGVD